MHHIAAAKGIITLQTQACGSRWDQNWIIHLDGVFQTTDRGGDHHVHVAKGMRRLVIKDTLKETPAGFIGGLPSESGLTQLTLT